MEGGEILGLRVLKGQNNNLIIWKARKNLTVNIDQVRIHHERSDENVIRIGNSDSSGSEYQTSSFEGVRPRSDRSQNCRNSEAEEEGSKSPGHTTRIQATGRSLDAKVVRSGRSSRESPQRGRGSRQQGSQEMRSQRIEGLRRWKSSLEMSTTKRKH
ncbi:hypothetical protein TNCV_587951 [Trichonephila clavipes]|nr:hypothetical protein TNCV_587951 [Trichonephila clavipes]